MNPDQNVDGDMVNLGNVIDGRKGREIPVVCTDVYNRGLEWYAQACFCASEDIQRTVKRTFSNALRTKGKLCAQGRCSPSCCPRLGYAIVHISIP